MKITKHISLFVFAFLFGLSFSFADTEADKIMGKWMSTAGNLSVQVFKENGQFKAKVIWFNDSDDKSKPMDTRTDERNPDKTLRNRKLIGLEILKNLKYNPTNNHWENGLIYDPTSGKEWSSSLSLSNNGLLKVRGFWHFECFGKTLTFKRISS